MDFDTSTLVRLLERTPHPVLMALPLAGAFIVAGGLLFLVHEGSRLAESELTRQSVTSAIVSARPATTLAEEHGASAAGTKLP